MRHPVALWGLVAALALAGGCERREEVGEPKVYDPAVDSPPSTIGVQPDPLLLANQAEIAKKAPKPTAVRAAAGPVAATGESVEGVKSTLLRLLDAVEAKQVDAVAGFFVPEDAGAVQAVLAALPALQEKTTALNRLIRDKFGVVSPPEAGPLGGKMSGVGLPAWMTRTALMADPSPLQFLAQGDKVVVSRGGQEPITLVNMAGTWKIEPNPQERMVIGMSREFVKAMNTMADAAIAGINDGTITKDNFQAQMQAMADAHLGPIMTKFAALAQAQPGEAAGATPSAPAEEGTTPPGPEAAAAVEEELPEFPGERDDPGHLEAVTSLWLSNSRTDALGHFVQINWDKPGEFGPTAIYAISQIRFGAMGENERKSVTEQAAVQIQALKDLTTRLHEMATRLATAGNTVTAQKYVRAISGCAKFLQQPKRLLILREAGAAIAKLPDPMTPGNTVGSQVELTRPGDGPVDPGYLETVATIWACKEKEQALKEFMRIDWKKAAVLAPDSAFLATDEQVLAMTPTDRDLKVDEVSGLDKAVRELSGYVVSQAKADSAKAKRYIDALASLSSFLQQPQYMLLLQSRGEMISRMTDPAGKPIGTGPKPPPNVAAPSAPTPAPAPAPTVAPAPAPAAPQDNVNAGRGPEAGEQLRNQLLAPVRRAPTGGE